MLGSLGGTPADPVSWVLAGVQGHLLVHLGGDVDVQFVRDARQIDLDVRDFLGGCIVGGVIEVGGLGFAQPLEDFDQLRGLH